MRELSKEFQASAATVSAALSELTALGLVRAEPGRAHSHRRAEQLSEPDFAWQSQALGPAAWTLSGRRAGGTHPQQIAVLGTSPPKPLPMTSCIASAPEPRKATGRG